MKKIIENYIHNITEKDIDVFARKNKMVLSKDEIDTLYTLLKTKYEVLLYGDPSSLLNTLQNNLTDEHYKEVIRLYLVYKEKYQNYL